MLISWQNNKSLDKVTYAPLQWDKFPRGKGYSPG